MYNWTCPSCGHTTIAINRMADSEVPPEKCDPQSERTGEKDAEGHPIYKKFVSCGHTDPTVESEAEDGSVTPGWKKQIGGCNFILRGTGWANTGYS